ncbi:ABC transporter permease subunit [Halosimplex rubrum]|uniref:ABC transporter permease subunit n=1 Tax=Halosimplex rubrum TaxID=869889 RepID=A0A7D5P2T6_9EURY|nr:ABC transporter permease subunit [Halosimplex rubrum]QLH76122.1 ABC transporter permease subunit [Halosimplex rubrum]
MSPDTGTTGASADTARAVPDRDPGRLARLSTAVGRRAVTALIGVTVVFLVAPVALTLVASFAGDWTGVLPRGLGTLDNWRHVLGLQQTVGAQRALGSATIALPGGYSVTIMGASLVFSLVIALCGVLINLVVGVPIAYAVTRYDFPGVGWLNTAAVLPLVPGVILGIAFLRTYPGLPSAAALVIGYSLLKIPYMILAVQSSFESMDLRQLEESARSLGASWPRTFLTVIVPSAKRGILSGAIVCWTLAAAEFNFSYMVYSRGPRPFSIFLYNNITNSSILQTAAAVSLYFLIVAGVTVALQATGQRGFSIGGVR